MLRSAELPLSSLNLGLRTKTCAPRHAVVVSSERGNIILAMSIISPIRSLNDSYIIYIYIFLIIPLLPNPVRLVLCEVSVPILPSYAGYSLTPERGFIGDHMGEHYKHY